MYIQVKDSTIEKIYHSKPKWYSGDPAVKGIPLTDEQFKEQGVLPVVDGRPEINELAQSVEVKPQEDWVIGESEVTITYNITDISFEECSARVVNKLKQVRQAKNQGGITVGGEAVRTDVASRIELISATVMTGRRPTISYNWKLKNGWKKLNKADINAMADAVSDHVQACFDREYELSVLIDVCTTIEELLAIDIESGWPATIN